MASKTIRTILALDGEQQFRNKLTQINSQLTSMKANIKQLTSEYDTNGKKVKDLANKKNELKNQSNTLKQKIEVLKDAIKANEEAYKNANKEYEKAVQEHGAESDEAKRLEKALVKLEQRTNSYRTQLANTRTELNQVNASYRDVSQQMNKSNADSEQLGKTIKTLGSGFKNLELGVLKTAIQGVTEEVKIAAEGFGLYVTAVTAAAAAITKFAIGAGADFEEGMSGVEAIAGATADEMENLTEKAQKLGATTKFTAKEVSDGFNYMAMAGWSADDMISGIDGVINLAAASGEELGLVSDIVTDSLTAFGMEARDASRYADILAQAATNANTNVGMMGETFQYCAPIAGAMGYKVDDMATAIGVMANAGIKGSMAGTSLRSIITNLAAPTDAAENAMEKLGITLTNEDGTMKSFDETVQQLRDGFAGLSEAEQAAAAKAIAGKPGMSGLLALVNASEEDFNKLSDAVGNCYGAAKQMADVKLDNFNGDVTYLKSAVDGLGNSLFEALNGKLRKGTQTLTMLVTKLTDGIKYGRDMNGVFRDLSSQVGIFLARGVESLRSNLPQFLQTFNKVFLEIVDQVGAIMPTIINNILPTLLTNFGVLLQNLSARLIDFIPVLIEGTTNLITQLLTRMNLIQTGIDIVMTVIRGLVAALPDLLTAGASALMEFINGIVDNLPELITMAVDIIVMLVQCLIDNVDGLLEASLKILIALAEGLVDNLDKIVEVIPDLLLAVVDAVIDNLDLIVQAAYEIAIALGYALLEFVYIMTDKIPEICDKIANKFKETDWKQVGQNIMDGIFGGVSDIANKAKDKLKGSVEAIKNSLKSAFDIHSPSKWAKETIGKNLVLGQVEGMEETAESENKRMFNALSGFGNLINSTANSVSNMLGSAYGAVTVSIGNVTLNNTDTDLDNLITDIESRIYERQLGRGR